MKKNIKSLFLLLAAAILISVAGCGSSDSKSGNAAKPAEGQAKESYIKVASSNTSGTWYIVCGAFTKLFEEKSPSIKWNVQSSGGSVENMRLVGTKQVQIGLAMTDVAYYAYKGGREFKDTKFENLRVIAGGNDMHYHLVARRDAGIKTIKDLKGKKVYWGTPGSGTRLMDETVFAAAGFKEGVDYKGMQLSLGDAVEALKDGDIDAIGHISGIPIPGIMDLFTTKDSAFVELDDELLTKINKENIYWPKGVIAANSYVGQTKDIPTLTCGTVMVTNTDVPDDVVYNITKTMVENSKSYESVHKACGEYNLKNTVRASKESGIPFHPGTEKYLKEVGALK